MSQPLTIDRFEQFEKKIFKQLDDQDEILTVVNQTIDDVAEKVDGIEKLLWHGQRLGKLSIAFGNWPNAPATPIWLRRFRNHLSVVKLRNLKEN